ncbi:hypothetical protein [Allocoleopsis franciscana]|uniref:hypothetical protein n=1 Tax=Allocoleopsis franciscana TaxID=2886352 RepID=UPI000316BEE3|nr:hypothetical protein [Allocoleopsis franciscana]
MRRWANVQASRTPQENRQETEARSPIIMCDRSAFQGVTMNHQKQAVFDIIKNLYIQGIY